MTISKALTAVFATICLFVACGCSAGAATAITLGATGGTVLLTNALTGSSITVYVETFSETDQEFENACKDPTTCTHKTCAKRPKQAKDRNGAFFMNKRAAIAKDVNGIFTIDPVKEPSLEAFRLVNKELSALQPGLKATVTETQKTLQAYIRAGQENGPVVNDFRNAIKSAEQLLRAIEAFQTVLRNAEADGTVTDVELQNLSQALLRVRTASIEAKNIRVSRDTMLELASHLEGQLSDAGLDEADAPGVKIDDISDDLTVTEKVRRIVRHYEELTGKIGDAMKKKKARDDIKKVVRNMGLDLDGVAVFQTIGDKTEAAIGATISANRQGAQVLEATFTRVTSSANLGPIRNEVLQMVNSFNVEIDAMLDKRNECRWKEWNSASSWAGAGDHNAIIYLENHATPVLKSAKFDPTKFIVANGTIFRKAFGAAVGVFGIPGAGGAAPGNIADFNLAGLAGRKANAAARLEALVKAVVNTMKAAIDAHPVVKAAADGDEKFQDGKKAAAVATVSAILDGAISALQQTP